LLSAAGLDEAGEGWLEEVVVPNTVTSAHTGLAAYSNAPLEN